MMDLRLFLEDIARGAGEITLKYFRQPDLEIITKGDASPVTRADRESEEYLRARIREHFPNDVILGEEFGEQGSNSARRWILDPLDGTKSFVHGVPIYGVLIALEQSGEVTHGIVHLPALGETVSAGVGEGCYWNGNLAHASHQSHLSHSLLCTTSPRRLEELIGRAKYDAITRTFGIYRGWGDCYGHILVATGRAEAMLDARMAIWDSAPLGVIVSEAGGEYFDFSGARRIDGGHLASCAPGVADEVRLMLS
ncbi:MAG: inositol monophosphatase family protein [Bacteroidota bacterium]|nr:inositol monophosphatase family protein [Bacteroidota bacterium]MDP4233743.1 inositol monophosphatase family protein [Bacteroidota bacterium]MDP4242382.1 inositol monophosphatase family protein [Bacteroidota bacterium]MDP4287504.1 inositol monophosphatase family protein [Bacteroidota bacterium]